MSVKAKLSDLIQNIECQSEEFYSFLNRRTGQVVTVSDEELRMAEDGEMEDECGDDVTLKEVAPAAKVKKTQHEEELVVLGRYRHYKGGEYEVIGVAKHSETMEEYVVYRALYGEGEFWVRPKEMFMEKVVVSGKNMPRFEFLGESGKAR